MDQAKEANQKAKEAKVAKKVAKQAKPKNQEKESKLLTGFKFTKNQENFLNSLRDNLGIISKAAHDSGLHRNNHFNWVKKYPEYALEYDTILEEQIDVVESFLFDNIKNNDTTAIIFYLKSKAKKRGYVERVENDVRVRVGKDLADEEYVY